MNDVLFQRYGDLPDGRAVDCWVLRSSFLEVSVCTFGARVVNLRMRGENDAWTSVVLGYPSLQDYVADPSYMGAIVGRYANRIAKGRFTLGSRHYQVSRNDGENSLHGGRHGFDRRNWTAYLTEGDVVLEYESQSGEEGYPGSLWATVRYAVRERDLRLTYEARSSEETPVNLTSHMYFNLGGNFTEDVLSHVVTLAANQFTPVDASLIPSGVLEDVRGTPMDFRDARSIGERIDGDHPQLRSARGYDHNWVLSKPRGVVGLAARVYHPNSKRLLTVLTSEPGLQFYSGNQLGVVHDASHRVHGYRCGLCLETQHFPDSPNQPNFPSTLLKPGEIYKSQTIYRFDGQASN